LGKHVTGDEKLTGKNWPNRISTIVTLQFQGNSKLLAGFWEAIEKNILK